jgi:hypothetical protein
VSDHAEGGGDADQQQDHRDDEIVKPKLMSESEVRMTPISVLSAAMRVR